MLLHLPSEILDQIVSYFEQDVTRRSRSSRHYELSCLCNLVLTCKRIQSIAEPYLYKNYARHLDNKNNVRYILDGRGLTQYDNLEYWYDAYGKLEQRDIINLRAFLRTLLKRPRLASHVQKIHLNLWGTLHAPELMLTLAEDNQHRLIDEKMFPLDMELSKLFAEAAARFELGGHWRTGLLRGMEDAEVALLLALTHNIRELNLRLPHVQRVFNNEDQYCLEAVFRQATRPINTTTPSIHQFSRLTRIALRQPYATDFFIPLKLVADVLRLPAVTAINIFTGPEMLGIEELPLLPCSVPTLTKLIIEKVTFPLPALSAILSSCRLKKLKIDYIRLVSWPHLLSLLRSQRDTLTDLTLFTGPKFVDEFEHGHIESIGSLQHFTKLKKLTLPQHAIIGSASFAPYAQPCPYLWDRLPASIEALIIYNGTRDILVQLSGLVDVRSRRMYMGLRKVELRESSFQCNFDLTGRVSSELDDYRIRELCLEHKRFFRAIKIRWVVDGVDITGLEGDQLNNAIIQMIPF